MAVQRTFTSIVEDKWWIAIVALGVSLIVTPIARFFAYRAKIVDRPDELLKPHGRPIAYLGGVAMCMGYLSGLACFLAVAPAGEYWGELTAALSRFDVRALLHNPLWNLLSVGLSSVLITVVGLVDDVREIRPRQKVFGQAAAAAILIAGGVGYRMLVVVLGPLGATPPSWVLVPLSGVTCVALVVATCNAANLLDGLDGLCGGVTAIIALGFLALAVWLAMWPKPETTGMDELRVVVCLAMAGAVLGFLPYNIPPASIFMGDAGSMLLGFFVATMMAMFCQEGTARWFIGAWAVFALPALDTALAVVRRLLAGRSIFAGDRSHLYDQLVDRGMSVKQVVVLFYVLAAVSAGIGVTVSIVLRLRYAIPLYLVLLVIVWVVFIASGMVAPPGSRRRAGRATDD